jgi:hypothetical protein
MTKNVYRIMAVIPVGLAGLGLIVGLAGCCSIVKSCLQQVLIFGQPQCQVVFTNTEATFSVDAAAGPPFTKSGLTYQWQVNTYLLDPMNPDANWTNYTGLGATNSTITITNVQLSDVGYYRVLVSASGSTTVTSAAPYLQVVTPGSIIVNGTPIAGGGGGHYCTGGPFAGYIPFTNCPPCGLWGWAVIDTSQAISGTDNVPTPNSRVAYIGYNGDVNCGIQTISKSPPITAANHGSPRYKFMIYFQGAVPTAPRPYPLSITNLQ